MNDNQDNLIQPEKNKALAVFSSRLYPLQFQFTFHWLYRHGDRKWWQIYCRHGSLLATDGLILGGRSTKLIASGLISRFVMFLRRQINKYSRVVKRCDDGNKLTTDLLSMINERAELEKAFSKMLKGWSKKWSEYVVKCERVSHLRRRHSNWFLIFVLSLSSSTWIRLDDSSLESTYEWSRYVSWRSSDRSRWITSRCYPGDQVMAKNEIHQIDDAYKMHERIRRRIQTSKHRISRFARNACRRCSSSIRHRNRGLNCTWKSINTNGNIIRRRKLWNWPKHRRTARKWTVPFLKIR